MATQIGAHYLERENGGRGVLLGGAPGVAPARVVVIGAGNVGWNAAWIAAGMEAEVVLLDKNLDRLRFVDQIHKGRISTLASNRGTVERAVARADLVIGAVLVPGGRAPVLISEDMVAGMKQRSVIVDVAVDQGGCVETIHETTHEEPIYEAHGVVHYAVGNMPGAVPNTSTFALTNATLPYLVQLASGGIAAAAQDPVLCPRDQHPRWPGHPRRRRRGPGSGAPGARHGALTHPLGAGPPVTRCRAAGPTLAPMAGTPPRSRRRRGRAGRRRPDDRAGHGAGGARPTRRSAASTGERSAPTSAPGCRTPCSGRYALRADRLGQLRRASSCSPSSAPSWCSRSSAGRWPTCWTVVGS